MIVLVPIGEVNKDVLVALVPALEEVFCQKTCIGDGIEMPTESWNRERGQHLASSFLAVLPSSLPSDDRVLGVVDVDIYTPRLNFIFGQAEVAGKRALISLKRLRQEFYGLPRDDSLYRQRVLKEAVHELGHTYGLGHCSDRTCVMHFSNSLADTDLKGWEFCTVCKGKVGRKLYRGDSDG